MIDTTRAKDISQELIAILVDDCGYSVEESIGGLIQAVIEMAHQTAFEEALLDEASNLLADGGAPEDPDESWIV